ncbi:DUF262 domain-containing protein [Asaia sp. VD9]|uniref:DUF262 domain-containing protein n=1 Tax=Asaia sp. VD9 TaxID=3081235 RepID=UPI003017CB80
MTRSSFSQLMARVKQVEIPIIQRDYVQGSDRHSLVRDGFLEVLCEALTATEARPLDLDFVYGSIVNGVFQPLDGQQRLTTLFLLHWYLAWRDRAEDHFRACFTDKGRSLFRYEVRPSSHAFFNALATNFPQVETPDGHSLSEIIRDQPWYFRNWRLDPTVCAALSMLDSLHLRFAGKSGLYERLIDDSQPLVTFQLLELEGFGLSDDLYIKMNARGKSLTPFETLKARLEKDLEELFDGVMLPAVCKGRPVASFFADRIDNAWSDFLWKSRGSEQKNISSDEAAMNLLRALIVITRPLDAATTDQDLTDLRRGTEANGYDWFHRRGWLDRALITATMTLLEHWSSHHDEPFRLTVREKRHLDEAELFQNMIRKPKELTYVQFLQLAAYTQYLVRAEEHVSGEGFSAWMRVITNLAENTEYAGSDDLRRSLNGLQNFAAYMDNVHEYLVSAEGGEISGRFNRLQCAEERIKAHLILQGEGWSQRIALAEEYDYFRGQIGFLLRFCGIDLDRIDDEIARLDAQAVQALVVPFERYLACAKQMMDDLLKSSEDAGRRWERALLTLGNFLRPVGRNRSLLVTQRDEAGSWKQLLYDAARGDEHALVLKALWDKIGHPESCLEKLDQIIADPAPIDAWRAAIIRTPGVYTYVTRRMLRFEGGNVYLLKTTQMNGRHTELFVYSLHEELRNNEAALSFFRVERVDMPTAEDYPHILLSKTVEDGPQIKFRVSFSGAHGRWEFRLDCSRLLPSSDAEAELKAEGFEWHDQEVLGWFKTTDPDSVMAVINSLDRRMQHLLVPFWRPQIAERSSLQA